MSAVYACDIGWRTCKGDWENIFACVSVLRGRSGLKEKRYSRHVYVPVCTCGNACCVVTCKPVMYTHSVHVQMYMHTHYTRL